MEFQGLQSLKFWAYTPVASRATEGERERERAKEVPSLYLGCGAPKFTATPHGPDVDKCLLRWAGEAQ